MDTTAVKKPDVEASGQGELLRVGAPYQARGEMGQLAAAILTNWYSQKLCLPRTWGSNGGAVATVFLQLSLWCLSSLSWIGTLRMISPELVVPDPQAPVYADRTLVRKTTPIISRCSTAWDKLWF